MFKVGQSVAYIGISNNKICLPPKKGEIVTIKYYYTHLDAYTLTEYPYDKFGNPQACESTYLRPLDMSKGEEILGEIANLIKEEQLVVEI